MDELSGDGVHSFFMKKTSESFKGGGMHSAKCGSSVLLSACQISVGRYGAFAHA